ncbi:MAG: ATP-binding protein [Paramuribaculum sp.]
MKDLKAIRGERFLTRAIAEGEHERQDFKFAISDARKIARSLSAFANHSGGALLIGVKDNGVIAGVRNEEDIYVIEQAAQLYCRPEQSLTFTAYRTTDGAIVIRAEIRPSDVRPVMACDTDGQWKAYYRVADENILATPLMVRAWRRRNDSTPLTLSMGSAEETLLATIRAEGHTDITTVMQHARLSRRTAEEMVARLYALGVIDFAFINREFRIVMAENTPE